MPQISKYPLAKDIDKQLRVTLWQALSELSNKEEVSQFLEDLLTRTERTMLSKRLYVALLLEKGYSYGEIKQVLKVSSSTIGSVNNMLKEGQGYKLVVKSLIGKEKMNEFFIRVDSILGKVGTMLSAKSDMRARAKLYKGQP